MPILYYILFLFLNAPPMQSYISHIHSGKLFFFFIFLQHSLPPHVIDLVISLYLQGNSQYNTHELQDLSFFFSSGETFYAVLIIEVWYMVHVLFNHKNIASSFTLFSGPSPFLCSSHCQNTPWSSQDIPHAFLCPTGAH